MLNIDHEQVVRLARASLDGGKPSEAESLCRELLQRQPAHAEGAYLLGVALYRMGRLAEAVDFFQTALNTDASSGNAWYALAMCQWQLGKMHEAATAARRLVAIAPGSAEGLNILGTALASTDRLEEAAEVFQRAISIDSRQSITWGNLAGVQARMGLTDGAIASFRQAVALDPVPHRFHSDLIYTMLHHPGYDRAAIFSEHLEWARLYAEPLSAEIKGHQNSRDPDRRLKIGYVSSNFRTQAVSYFVEPILDCHNHDHFEIICYHDSGMSDAVTARMRAKASIWREVVGMQDADLASLIRTDAIDILVDLNGHLPQNRLLVFARKPAPVQVTYIGYQTTTGMQTMDYRLTDPFVDPPGAEVFHTEKLARLPLFFTYKPPAASPPVGPEMPADRNGYVTLGSLNNCVKVGSHVISLWADILKKLPESRLVLLVPGGDGATHVIKRFRAEGIDSSRLELRGISPVGDYLRIFNGVDICIDTFPFTGHTTTCDALWMGVPVVTLLGESYPSRMSACVVESAGLGELVSRTPQEYAAKIVELAGNLEKLRHMRRGLRERFAASDAMNAPRFTAHLEAEYQTMWRKWCSEGRGFA